jgi:hypothetical protein
MNTSGPADPPAPGYYAASQPRSGAAINRKRPPLAAGSADSGPCSTHSTTRSST